MVRGRRSLQLRCAHRTEQCTSEIMTASFTERTSTDSRRRITARRRLLLGMRLSSLIVSRSSRHSGT